MKLVCHQKNFLHRPFFFRYHHEENGVILIDEKMVTEELTSAENVASVKTSLVIRGAKDQPGVPFEVLEERLSKQP